MTLPLTSSQTVGPFFSVGLSRLSPNLLHARPAAPAKVFSFHGVLLDGDSRPVPDAFLELWQADPAGEYLDRLRPALPEQTVFAGFARVPTDDSGFFHFSTVMPGQVPHPSGILQAPHVVVTIFMRGLLRHLLTRIYFPGEPSNAADPVLALVPPDRRNTLIATAQNDSTTLQWNIHLQGQQETVFFDC